MIIKKIYIVIPKSRSDISMSFKRPASSGPKRLPGPDAADALGLAITHAHAHKAMARLALADGVIGAGKGKYKAGRSR